jgi:hypothetical protein
MCVLDGGSNPAYAEMRKMWDLYRKTREPNVSVYFLKFTDQEGAPFLDKSNATLYQHGKESLIPGVLEKTKGAIEYFCKNTEFDYFYRTNISSVFDFDTMLEYLENNPVDYAGKLENAFDEYEFASGSGYVLSRRACDIFLEHYGEMESQHDLFDDVATGKIMQKYVKMSYIPRVTFSYTEDPEILDLLENDYREIYHYRCHSDEHHQKTVYYMRKIYNKIYGSVSL